MRIYLFIFEDIVMANIAIVMVIAGFVWIGFAGLMMRTRGYI